MLYYLVNTANFPLKYRARNKIWRSAPSVSKWRTKLYFQFTVEYKGEDILFLKRRYWSINMTLQWTMIQCNFSQKCKKILRSGSRATLNFWNFKVIWTNSVEWFFNFNLIIKNGDHRDRFEVMNLKLKLRVFLAGHIVTVVTCYIKTMTCLLMIEHLYDNITVASLAKQW